MRDIHLADSRLAGLSVKLRQSWVLEAKAYRHPGILRRPGAPAVAWTPGPSGRFPVPGLTGVALACPGWRPVRKLIRRFALASGKDRARVPLLGEKAKEGGQVELTEIRGAARPGLTLAFEAIGPPSLRSFRPVDENRRWHREAPVGARHPVRRVLGGDPALPAETARHPDGDLERFSNTAVAVSRLLPLARSFVMSTTTIPKAS